MKLSSLMAVWPLNGKLSTSLTESAVLQQTFVVEGNKYIVKIYIFLTTIETDPNKNQSSGK